LQQRLRKLPLAKSAPNEAPEATLPGGMHGKCLAQRKSFLQRQPNLAALAMLFLRSLPGVELKLRSNYARRRPEMGFIWVIFQRTGVGCIEAEWHALQIIAVVGYQLSSFAS